MRTNGAGEADVRRTAWTRHAGRARRGSALILVLVMTLSLAGLAISAVLLTSSSMLVQRYYDKDKDFRFFAMAGAALVKSTVQRDTTLTIPTGTPYQALTAATIADASGGTNAAVKVNAYVAYTGDTAGTYIPFLTILAQAYDTMGVRSVQRRDLRSEAYSRYALFTDTSSSSIFPLGQVIRGRMHANRNWTQTATSPGPDFYDTVTVVGSITGTANYHGITAVTGAQRLKWPTTTSLTTLGTLASAGDLTVTPVTPSATFPAYCGQTSGGVDLSGKPSVSANFPCSFFGYTTRMTNGTRIRLRPVDVNNNGTYDAAEGFLEVFDLAPGIDTSSLRADLPTSGATNNNIVIQNQCGLMVTMSTGRREFFPVARFRDPWVLHRIHLNATAPTINWAGGDSATMGGRAGNSPSAAAVNKILTFGVGYSRCFPAGSSYLMLTERYANAAASCTVTTSTGDTPYAWGNSATNCPQYGGQDTTFTVTVTRCRIRDSQQCEDPQVSLGSWRAFGGTSSASPPAAVLQS
ncbi:MAG TPA: hypothetical protein VG916_02785, partial [Gemmatimonadaceae bacterium]|nr:hypothetical protein [Gemmatimonadaceae bacterium]